MTSLVSRSKKATKAVSRFFSSFAAPVFNERILCFNLRASFRSAPPEIVLCPCCSYRVFLTKVLCSEPGEKFKRTASIPLIETYVTQCSICGWWAIREFREDREVSAGYDYVVMVSPDFVTKHDKDVTCWELVLKDDK